jgi:alcohol dehydrogenase class IV
MTITGSDCYPDVAILDPTALISLPKNPAIYAGYDALVHACEAIHSLRASLITDTLAYSAIVTLMGSIARGTLTMDIHDKHTQLVGSTMANMACGNASLGLVHAMGTAMSEYNLPHGYKNGILLPYIMEFNLPVCRKKYEHILYELGCDSSRAELLIDKVKAMYIDTDFVDRLPADKVPINAIPHLTEIVAKHPFPKFNIRKVTEFDIKEIYEKAFKGWKG